MLQLDARIPLRELRPARDQRPSRPRFYQRLGLRLLLGLVPAWALLWAAPALATVPRTHKSPPPPQWITNYLNSKAVGSATCASPSLSQPFRRWGDSAYYALAPGQSASQFTGTGWMLMNGAHVRSTRLSNGRTGKVLDLPSGSLAVSPPMCVTANYPKARTMIRDVTGGGGVAFYVTYFGTTSWSKARNGGTAKGPQSRWTLSDPINLQPSHIPGWQIVRFALVPSAGSSEFQISDFYVDPYAKG
jgi:hypothetical protein